ncbi:ABC transporter ATP-binding protein [Xylanibacillus composti]|uniref:ABC-type transporter ATP-binding protein EcsA n=1 Tax=Xylanibacillus composti TaxID=1572762 RepID=A0A8J4H4D6_9BACL|nr:ABC transporter ATP-binding protein [Xylanibacillus composti]MDT9723480.1 ABC transporter ATP-binding protein [Xylanibacillus composti]GIQ68483.1 ABC-type transporter ATP-binding protein EcsA [Xylanibacillus composti]
MNILQVDGLTGGYSRNRPVLHDISFAVRPGEMVGMVGLNGAGKSTTMKHLLGLLIPHSGSVRIKGVTLKEQPDTYRAAYAYVPEHPLVFEELTVREHLRLTAMAYGIEAAAAERRVQQLLGEFRMDAKADVFPGHLSKGMQQKLMIMNAFLVQPDLYLIDEPFLGLDPLGIRSLLDQLREVRSQGAGILMSSHILATLEQYCDRYVVIHEGRVRAWGTLDEIRNAWGGKEGERLEDVFYRIVDGAEQS